MRKTFFAVLMLLLAASLAPAGTLFDNLGVHTAGAVMGTNLGDQWLAQRFSTDPLAAVADVRWWSFSSGGTDWISDNVSTPFQMQVTYSGASPLDVESVILAIYRDILTAQAIGSPEVWIYTDTTDLLGNPGPGAKLGLDGSGNPCVFGAAGCTATAFTIGGNPIVAPQAIPQGGPLPTPAPSQVLPTALSVDQDSYIVPGTSVSFPAPTSPNFSLGSSGFYWVVLQGAAGDEVMWASEAPEPATLMTIGGALVLLAAGLRKRRQKA